MPLPKVHIIRLLIETIHPEALFASPRSLFTKRYCRILFFALFSSIFLFILAKFSSSEPISDVGRDLVLLPPLYPSSPPSDGLPPMFEAWNEYERNLFRDAEHDTVRKFIYMKNHVSGSGWGNALQEMLLNAHLAYISGRSFVFDNYTWDRSPSEYSSFNGRIIPSRVPLSALLAGPMIGGSFGPLYSDDPLFNVDPSPESHPRFVSSEFYERICDGQKTMIDTAPVHDSVASWDGEANLAAWVKHLSSLPDRCVEIDVNAEHIFNIWMFGSTQLLSLWPSLSCSPILRRFTYSPLVLGMFERHHHLFGLADAKSKRQPFYQLVPSLGSFLPDVFGQSLLKPQNLSVAPPLSTVPLGHLSAIYPHSPASPQTTDTIPGLLVLHIRRGDFAQHCINLVEWGAEFNAFNSFEDIRQRDRFDVAATGGTSPPGEEPAPPEGELEFAARVDEMSKEEKERSKKAYKESLESYASAKRDYDKRKAKYEAAKINYLKRCYPDIDQIVKHVREIRNTVSAEEFPSKSRSTAPLTHIYVMTNGKPPFLAKLRAAFKSDAIIPNDLNLPPWESIYTSRDLELGWEEGYVAQALDMYIAQRADVFVGNGFSSLTSNIVMLRMANGVESVKTRLW